MPLWATATAPSALASAWQPLKIDNRHLVDLLLTLAELTAFRFIPNINVFSYADVKCCLRIRSSYCWFYVWNYSWCCQWLWFRLKDWKTSYKQMHSVWMHSVYCVTFDLFFCICLLTRDLYVSTFATPKWYIVSEGVVSVNLDTEFFSGKGYSITEESLRR